MVSGAASSASSGSRPSREEQRHVPPPMRIWTNSIKIAMPCPRHRAPSAGHEPHQPGLGNLVSNNDLGAVAAFAFSSTDNMRGWLVPGFCQREAIRSACSTSSTVTEPLPMPIRVDQRGTDDSWHMFEQSAGCWCRSCTPTVVQKLPHCWYGPRCETAPRQGSQGGQLVGDQPVSRDPVDRLVVGGAQPQHHRLGQPALLRQPVLNHRPVKPPNDGQEVPP